MTKKDTTPYLSIIRTYLSIKYITEKKSACYYHVSTILRFALVLFPNIYRNYFCVNLNHYHEECQLSSHFTDNKLFTTNIFSKKSKLMF